MAEDDKKSSGINRRQFFSGVRNSTLLATGGLSSLSLLSYENASAFSLFQSSGRLSRGYELRIEAARAQEKLPAPEYSPNGDESRYENLIAGFSKGLPHNGFGEVDRSAYEKLKRALISGDANDFDAIPVGGPVKLANPQAALAYQLDGADSRDLGMIPAPAFASEEQGGELAELYWQALARDVPYAMYGKEPITVAAIEDLRRFEQFKGIDAGRLFRGNTPGDRIGPYFSQFIWKDVPYGSQVIIQKYNSPTAGRDFMVEPDDCLQIQRGAEATDSIVHAPSTRYIRSGRDIGEWVHSDYPFQGFLNAALILLSYGDNALKFDHPYRDSRNQAGFVTLGGPDILTLVAHASACAMKAAWYQKWLVHRRLRPEAYGLRVHHHVTGGRSYPIAEKLLSSEALARVQTATGHALLPMAYPEGCPTHPSYPAAHAVIAGACLSVLKAFFNEEFVIPDPVLARPNGFSLAPYRGDDLTVGGELTKLASNISLGRDFAGLHWRSDSVEGMKLGEQVAIRMLMDAKLTYNEKYDFSFTRLDGSEIRI